MDDESSDGTAVADEAAAAEEAESAAVAEADASSDAASSDAAESSSVEEALERPVEGLLSFMNDLVPVDWLSPLLVVALASLATAVVARVAVKLVRKVLTHDSVPLPSSSIFVNIVRVVVWAIGASVILSTCFGIDVTGAVAALGVGGIAISLGFQDTLSNLISGLQLSLMNIVEPGDYIELSGQRGIVRDVTWRHTTFETSSGERIIVPNSVLNTSAFVHLPPPRKVSVPISVATDGDGLDAAAQCIADAARVAAETVGPVEKGPTVQFSEIAATGFTGSIVVWMAEGADASAVKDAVVRAVAPLTRRA